MSGYYNDGDSRRDRDEPRRERRSRRAKDTDDIRDTRRPIYEEDIIEYGHGRPIRAQTALVRRPRDESTSSVEEIRREFDPDTGAYTQRRTRRYPRDDNASRHSDGGAGAGRRRRRRGGDRGEVFRLWNIESS